VGTVEWTRRQLPGPCISSGNAIPAARRFSQKMKNICELLNFQAFGAQTSEMGR